MDSTVSAYLQMHLFVVAVAQLIAQSSTEHQG